MITWDTIRYVIETIWLINLALAFWTVFRERRDIASTWAWLLVLSFLPVVGFVAYLFVGRKLSHDQIFTIQDEQRRILEQYKHQQQRLLEAQKLLPKEEQSRRDQMMANLLLNTDNALLTFGNQVHLFTDGHAKFDQLIKDIDQAKRHVHVEYYTFAADQLGHRVLAALERAAERGVEVRVLYDLSGSRGTIYRFFSHLEELGGQAQAFISSAKARFNTPRLNYHLHRKLVIIDGDLGYIGGFNIGDQYLGESPKFGYWRDSHLRVEGTAVLMMQARFIMDWNTTCRRTKKERMDLAGDYVNVRTTRLKNLDRSMVPMQIVSSGPDNDNRAIRRGYQGIISSARHYVYIQTPYLIPDDAILESLVVAAKSGIDVRIMIPPMPDHPFVYRATEYFAHYLVSNGVKVYKYDKGFLHAKTMVSGSHLASVGSANLDYRSFRLNFEVNAFTYNEQLAGELKAAFENDLKDCTQMNEEYFDQQSVWRKFKQDFCRLLAPIL